VISRGGSVLVVCTFRNAGATLEETLDSLSQQSLRDWRAVLVDDGSTDSSRSIADAAAAADPRFTVVPSHGEGRGSALNLAISQGEEDLVAIIDADDVAHPEWLCLLGKAARRDRDYAVIGVGSVSFSSGDPFGSAPPVQDASEQACVDVTLRLCRLNPISHSGAMIRRGALARVGGYDAGRSSQFDYDLWVRIALAGGRIARLDHTLVAKRVHRGQRFKQDDHFGYVLRSLSVQSRAIAGLDPRLSHRVFMLARLVWGLAPRTLRLALRTRP
jgi:glycosyltransferase involved in cell wall biosynthesis